MTIEELNAIVPEEHRAAVGAFIEEIKASGNPLSKITDEGFNALLKGNIDLQKIVDARMTKGLDTWQKNNIDKIYKERYAKEHPDETEDQKRIKALEITNSESERRAKIANDRSDAISLFTTNKVEGAAELAALLFDDGKTAIEKAQFLSTYATSLVERTQKATHERILKENGRVLEDHPDEGGKYYTTAQIAELSDREFSENQEKVLESMKYNQINRQ